MSSASLQLGGDNWAAKDGNLLGYQRSASSSVHIPHEFTFTRGSNLAATRVAANGLIEKGRENLLLQSNQFDTTPWASSVTLTEGQSGYDGSNDAWLLTKTSSGAQSVYNYINETGIMTMSVYAKAGSTNWMRLTQGGKTAYFDLSGSGAVGASSNGIDQTITSVGNGWFRCTLTANKTTAGQTPIYPYTAEGDASGSTDSIYIQDSQLEQGLVATDYIETGATTVQAGLLEDEPRIDYTGGTGSLLLEPSRTNSYIYHSEYITSSLANISREISNVDSPIKDTPFLKITKTGTGISRFPFTSFSTNGDFDTCSVFAKAGSSNILLFADSYNGLSTVNAKFNLTNGDWDETPSGSALHDYGFEDFGNGMYRVWVCGQTYNTDTPEITARWRTPAVYCDIDQLPLGEYIYITGMQTEKNATYPTSYIPNHSGGSVTRELDHCFTSSNSVLEEISATYFLELTPIQITSNNLLEVRANGSTNNRILLQTNSGGALRVLVRAQGSSVLDQNISGAVSSNTKVKIALKYTDRTNISVFVDGVKEIDSDLVIDFNPELNGLDLEGSATNNNDSLKQHQFLFFPTALSDSECITLTS